MKLFLTIMFFIQQKVTEIGKFLLSILYKITVKPVKAIRDFNFKDWLRWNLEDFLCIIVIIGSVSILSILLGMLGYKLYYGYWTPLDAKDTFLIYLIGSAIEVILILLYIVGIVIFPWIQDNWKLASKRANKTLKKRNKK